MPANVRASARSDAIGHFTEDASSGRAASLRIFMLHLRTSVLGSLAGSVWHAAGWSGVVGLVVVLYTVIAALARWLDRIATLLTSPTR